jgi:hypothetical protein
MDDNRFFFFFWCEEAEFSTELTSQDQNRINNSCSHSITSMFLFSQLFHSIFSAHQNRNIIFLK